MNYIWNNKTNRIVGQFDPETQNLKRHPDLEDSGANSPETLQAFKQQKAAEKLGEVFKDKKQIAVIIEAIGILGGGA